MTTAMKVLNLFKDEIQKKKKTSDYRRKLTNALNAGLSEVISYIQHPEQPISEITNTQSTR